MGLNCDSYARVSQDGLLTLVITPGAKLQTTLWAYSGCETVAEARANLKEREGTSEKNIGALEEETEGINAVEQAIAR